MTKVVPGGKIFFKDDIKILDTELTAPLNLPQPPIVYRDELQIFYNGHIFTLTNDLTPDLEMKVYTMYFGLKEESPKAQEEEYFSKNAAAISKAKSSFIEKVVSGITVDGEQLKGTLSAQISSELIKKITEHYFGLTSVRSAPPGKGLITQISDNSIFSSLAGYERVLLLDQKVYNLLTIPEFISKFKKAMEENFYKELIDKSAKLEPEKVAEMLTNNKDRIVREVFPLVRNKIWNSDRSTKILLDGVYWIPDYNKSGIDNLRKDYGALIEKVIKTAAAEEASSK